MTAAPAASSSTSTTRSQGSHRFLCLARGGSARTPWGAGVIRRTPGNTTGGGAVDARAARAATSRSGRSAKVEHYTGLGRWSDFGCLGLQCRCSRRRAHKSETLGRVQIEPERQARQREIGPVEGKWLGRIELQQECLELECECGRVQTGEGLRNRCLRQHRRERPELSSRREHCSHARHQSRDRRVADERHAPVTDSYRVGASEYTSVRSSTGGPPPVRARRIGPCP